MLIAWKVPKRIADRTKCPRGPHAARVFETTGSDSSASQKDYLQLLRSARKCCWFLAQGSFYTRRKTISSKKMFSIARGSTSSAEWTRRALLRKQRIARAVEAWTATHAHLWVEQLYEERDRVQASDHGPTVGLSGQDMQGSSGALHDLFHANSILTQKIRPWRNAWRHPYEQVKARKWFRGKHLTSSLHSQLALAKGCCVTVRAVHHQTELLVSRLRRLTTRTVKPEPKNLTVDPEP